MGKSLVQWFLYCVVISIFAAYLSGRTLAPGTAFLQVFRVVGIAALLGYGAAHAQESIWNGRSWVVTFKHLFDSVIFAALTAANIRLAVAEIAVAPFRLSLLLPNSYFVRVLLLVVFSHVRELISAVPFFEYKTGVTAKHAVALPIIGFDRLALRNIAALSR